MCRFLKRGVVSNGWIDEKPDPESEINSVRKNAVIIAILPLERQVDLPPGFSAKNGEKNALSCSEGNHSAKTVVLWIKGIAGGDGLIGAKTAGQNAMRSMHKKHV